MGRRKLDLQSADEVRLEIERLRRNGYRQTAKWNLTQICQHLTATMNGGLDGFGFRLPWILRATVIKWGFLWALRRRRLSGGFPTFRVLQPEHQSVDDDDEIIDTFLAVCQKVEEFQGPIVDYPLLDNLDVDPWREFMWIHAAHHLSFLEPADAH